MEAMVLKGDQEVVMVDRVPLVMEMPAELVV
jgi:hypothetical protein